MAVCAYARACRQTPQLHGDYVALLTLRSASLCIPDPVPAWVALHLVESLLNRGSEHIMLLLLGRLR